MKMENKFYFFNNKRTEKFNYILHLPEDFKAGLPMIVALHGAGERGDDHKKITVHGVARYISEGLKVPAVVLAPQCPSGFTWNMLTVELKELIDSVAAEYEVDADRISLTGLSMGGFGTWEMGINYPGFFSALAPICGGGMSWRVGEIGKTPVWTFHGDSDDVVPPEGTYAMVAKLRSKGGNVKFTVFQGVKHNSWAPAYEDTKVIDWLIAQNRKDLV